MRLKIDLPIYNTCLWVFFVPDVAATADAMAPTNEKPRSCWSAMTLTQDTLVRILFSETPDHNEIAHEIFHAVDNILGYRGIHLVPGSEEAYAYLIGHITRCIYRYMARHGIEAQI